MKKAILGISAFYHDSAAALLVDGKIVAAAQEERFTRKKHDSSFPIHACRYVLQEAGLDYNSLSAVAFYEKPFLKFERLLETYHAFAPSGFVSFGSAMLAWIKEKIFMRRMLRKSLAELGDAQIPIYFPEHHLSHAASAFYPSPFEESAILTIDGVGEWATTTIGRGRGKSIEILKELHFPHSIGLLYSAFTFYTGFAVNSGEYKLMGLAPYGNPDSPRAAEYKKKMETELVDLRKDGSVILNMDYFDYATGLKMANETKWEKLFGVPRRRPESEISQPYMDMALAIQQVTEESVLRLAATARALTGCKNLVMAGGVALNCVANGKLLRTGTFDDLWIQPAAGDAGGALGAVLAVWHILYGNVRELVPERDQMQGSYLGPEFSSKEITRTLEKYGAHGRHYDEFRCLAEDVARKLVEGNVVGWFQEEWNSVPVRWVTAAFSEMREIPRCRRSSTSKSNIAKASARSLPRYSKRMSANISNSTASLPTCCLSPPSTRIGKRPFLSVITSARSTNASIFSARISPRSPTSTIPRAFRPSVAKPIPATGN